MSNTRHVRIFAEKIKEGYELYDVLETASVNIEAKFKNWQTSNPNYYITKQEFEIDFNRKVVYLKVEAEEIPEVVQEIADKFNQNLTKTGVTGAKGFVPCPY